MHKSSFIYNQLAMGQRLICTLVISACSSLGPKAMENPPNSLVGHSNGEWQTYASDFGASKFTNLNLINKANVNKMKVAWYWRSADYEIKAKFETPMSPLHLSSFEGTPIMVDGILYVSTSLSQVAALDAVTGKEIWIYDAGSWRSGTPPNIGFVHRGVAYWKDKVGNKRIFVGTGDGHVICLDALSGRPVKNFGDHGSIALGVPVPKASPDPVPFSFGITSPPIICRDTVIVGSSIADLVLDNNPVRGDLAGFDVTTGALKWIFHTIPIAAEFGTQTWKNEDWKSAGHANVWAPMSMDPDLGYVYLPVSAPANDNYGGNRLGAGLFGNSLVALDCDSGKRVWHYQLVHHDLWDYDLPAAPVLYNTTVNGKPVKAVVQVTKQGFAFAFDRVSGKPIWPINEVSVPSSVTPGEETSPTQPVPSKPEPFDWQGVTEETLTNLSPQLRTLAAKAIEGYKTGPLFTPPTSAGGTITLPGRGGGGNWSGAGYSPVTGFLYVPSYTLPSILRLLPVNPMTKNLKKNYRYSENQRYVEDPIGGKSFFKKIQEVPIFKPPFGRLTAIDMQNGQIKWVKPMGHGPKKALRELGASIGNEDLGWSSRTQVLITPELVLAGQMGRIKFDALKYNRYDFGRFSAENREPAIWVFDPVDGKKLTEIKLPMNVSGAPMTYSVNGKQFIVLPVGGNNQEGGLMALTVD